MGDSHDIAAVVAQRKSTHGDFTDHARITQALKEVARSSPSWPTMLPTEQEAIDMILHKIGRACAGNPHHEDHWLDIEGYARICRERLPQTSEAAR